MFTPQDIEKVSFDRATFGGYSIDQVDEFLEPLTEYYITLYKENALLKSKMRVLVTKLEEYRQNEASMKDAIVNAQKTCDKMVKEAEEKCRQMLSDANVAAAENTKNTNALIAEEQARVEDAKKEAVARIDELEAQLNSCIQALQRIKEANRPVKTAAPAAVLYDYEKEPDAPVPDPTAAMADEIAQNLEALVGTTEDSHPKADPQHPTSNTTSKFANLQFGPNYNPNHK
jgi:cell division initiation protein